MAAICAVRLSTTASVALLTPVIAVGPDPTALQNDLTVSLLQARLVELNIQIKVKVGTLT